MSTLPEPVHDSLIERARRRCQSARNYLLTYVRPELHRRAKARLNKTLRRKEDVSDLVQECMCKIIEKWSKFRGSRLDDFRHWVFKIQDNGIRKQQRFYRQKKRDRQREVPLALDGGVEGELAGSATSNLGRLVRKEECKQMMEALSWCREEDRELIVQRRLRRQKPRRDRGRPGRHLCCGAQAIQPGDSMRR